jgi:hypothetical protein
MRCWKVLPNTDYDLAGYLRRTCGEHLRDMLADPAFLACPSIAERLPRNLHRAEGDMRTEQAPPDLFSNQ